MKKVLAIVAVMLMAAPAVANDSLLAQLGLSGMQVVTANEASQVIGRGFVSADGVSAIVGAIAVGDVITDADVTSQMDLLLEGVSALNGALQSAGSIVIDESFNDGTDYSMASGTLTIVSGSQVSGSAD